jgi:PAS domain S-box-containing protein
MSNINLTTLFQMMPEGVICEDSTGMPIHMNPAAERMLGLTLEQLRGDSPIEPRWHAIDLDGSTYDFNTHPTLISLRSGLPVTNEILGIFNPELAKYAWFSINSTPEFKAGEAKPSQIFITFRDITEQIETERKVKAQSDLLELLVFTSTSYINLPEIKLQETINLSLKKLGEFVNADRMYIFDYNWVKQTCSNTYEWCNEGIDPQIEFLQDVPLEGLEDWTQNHLMGEQMYVENVLSLPNESALRQILEPQGIISLLAMPIMDNDNTVCTGFIGLDSVRLQHVYDDNEINLLKIFTSILSNVKNRMESERQLKERIKELRSIYQISNLTIKNDLGQDTLFQNIVEIIPQGFFEPEQTHTRIIFQGKTFESAGFTTSSNFIQEKIILNNKEAGTLIVFLPEQGEFLPEERELILAISNIIGQHFESKANLSNSRKNERQLQNLLNSQTSYVLRTDLAGKHTYWNEKFKEEFAWIYDQDDLSHGSALQSICHYHHERTLKTIQNCIQSPGKIFPIELDKPGKNNTIITTLWEFVALVNEHGTPTEIQWMGINISDRKKAETKLIESENRLRSLLESQTNYVVRTDLNGIHTFWNKKFEEDFGFIYPTKGLESSDSLSSICEYHIQEALSTVKKCIKSPGTVFQVELDKPTKSGKVMTTFWDFVCLTDSDGTPFEIQCVGIDITKLKETEKKLKESEEKYRFLFEESPDGYLVIQDDKFIDCNRAAEQMVLASKGELLGKSPSDISPEFQPNGRVSTDYANELIQQTLTKGQTEFEWLHTKKDGSEFLAEIKLSKLEKNGETTLFTTWRDITQKRKTETALIKSEERFRQISEHTGAVIWEVDETGLYTFMGPVAKRVFGYDPCEIVGKKYFWDLFPENQRETLKEIGLSHIKESFEMLDFENPIQRKDGEVIWVSSFGSAIRDEKGKIIGYRGADYDISLRKRAEEEMRKFRIISDQASYGTVITEYSSRKISYCNEAFARMHGYEIPELIGEEITTLHTPDQLEFYLKNIYPEYLDNKEYSIKEFGRKRKDGSTFPGMTTAKLFCNADGIPLFNAATVIDITEQKAIEEQIKDKTLRFKAIVEAIPDLLYIMDKEGNYLEYFSSHLGNMIGEFSDLVGKNLRDIFPQEQADVHFEKVQLALSENTIQTYENRGKQGYEDRYFEYRLVPISADKVLRFVREITDRKKSESEIRKLNLAIEQSPVAIIITDLDGRLDYMSSAFLKMTGYSYEELHGQPIGMIKSGLTDAKVYDDLWKTIKSGKNWQNEWINKKKTGELFWEFISITPILDEEGKIKSYLAVKQDISERKKYEEEIVSLNSNLEHRIIQRTKELEKINNELEIARNEADSANQAKSEFLSRMSHELRTPMNSILGFAQLMEFTELSSAQKRNLEYILKSGKHLLQLINEVLEIAKIESGNISISLEPIDLLSTIEEVVSSVSPFSTEKSIDIAFINGEFKSCFILADVQRVKQILINLLNNAIKYNNENGDVLIYLEQVARGRDSQYIRINIQDNGVGISEENIPKLFRPFERAGKHDSSIEGTGLGLSVVKKLTLLMGGTLGVESSLGVGSKFWIELPAAHASERIETISYEFPPVREEYSSGGKLLLVEDNFSNIQLINELLAKLSPESQLLNTMYGLECLSLAKNHLPSLILLDLNLPDTHGSKVLERLKSDPETRDIPVIVLSADATRKQIEEMLVKGADKYLTKPFNINDLITLFDQYLKK